MQQAGPGGDDRIRVVISDDHDLFRRGLRMVLEAEDDIEVVAEAANGQEAVSRVEELAPDVVLMDVRMPRMGGIEATRLIRQLFPTTRIIVLTVSDEEDDLYGAVKAGANGYLLKEVSIEEVADAVRAVFGGQSLISPGLASKLLAEFSGPVKALDDPLLTSARLTEREVSVLKLVALGHENAQIAAELGVSESTVRNHVANILIKLQLRSQIEPAT
ncbi:MAG: response regulator transcription factor [Actinomycetota bacterium]|nr:response regulator transcription factor [Actinomycetota bacterium]HEV2760086.1 response regulator transcription factor [Acidimicrobiales bacterium]